MSGLELARRVRRQPDAPRVILTSAHYNPWNSAMPVEVFLPKPVDPEQLHACSLTTVEAERRSSAIAANGASLTLRLPLPHQLAGE